MSKMISIRLPDKLYNDLKFISEKIPTISMSSLIVMATIKDLSRFKGLLDYGNM